MLNVWAKHNVSVLSSALSVVMFDRHHRWKAKERGYPGLGNTAWDIHSVVITAILHNEVPSRWARLLARTAWSWYTNDYDMTIAKMKKSDRETLLNQQGLTEDHLLRIQSALPWLVGDDLIAHLMQLQQGALVRHTGSHFKRWV